MTIVIFAQTTLYVSRTEHCLSATFKSPAKVITFVRQLMASVLDSRQSFSSVFKVFYHQNPHRVFFFYSKILKNFFQLPHNSRSNSKTKLPVVENQLYCNVKLKARNRLASFGIWTVNDSIREAIRDTRSAKKFYQLVFYRIWASGN